MFEKLKGFFALKENSKLTTSTYPREVRLSVNQGFGSSGTSIFGGYFSEEYLTDLTGYQAANVYDKMRRSDSRVKMVLSAVKNPIKAAAWQVEAAGDDEIQKRHKELIEHILFNDLGKSWKEFLTECLSAVDFGHSIFEKSHKAVLNHAKFGSYTGINQLGFRSQKSIYRWILNSESGKLDGVEQYVFGDLDRRVVMAGNTLLVFSLDKEGDNYEGISALRPCYGAYFRKQVYLKLMAIGIERNAVPTPKVKFPQGVQNDEQHAALINNLKALTSHEQNYIMYPNTYEIDFAQNSFASSQVKEAIQFENEEMSYALLENFLLLGGSGSSGSYALSNDLSDFFLSGVEGIADMIAEGINQNLIPELIRMNFGAQESYPKLKCTGISDKAGQEFGNLLKALSDGKYIIPDKVLEENIRKRLGLPKISEDGQRKLEGTATVSVDANLPIPNPDDTAQVVDGNVPDQPLSNTALNGAQVTALVDVIYKVASGQLPREAALNIIAIAFNVSDVQANQMLGDAGKGFTPEALPKAEAQFTEKKSLKLAENVKPKRLISDSASNLAQLMLESLQTIGDKLVHDLVKVFENGTPNERVSAYKNVSPKGVAQYKADMLQWKVEIAAKAIADARREVPKAKNVKLAENIYKGFKFEDLPAKLQKRLKAQSDLIVDTQLGDLEKATYFKYDSNLDAVSGSASMMEKALQDSVDEFVDGAVVSTGASTISSTTVNEARTAFFFDEEVLAEIESFTFINGDPVTPICQDLEGRTFSKDDPEAEQYFPPLHYNCKSYIVPNFVGSNKKISEDGLSPSTSELKKSIKFSEHERGNK